MDLLNTISCAVSSAYGAVVRKNRQAEQNNRLKAIVKSELGVMNRAYIALGKYYYKQLRGQASGDQAVLCSAIDQATERIQKARGQMLTGEPAKDLSPEEQEPQAPETDEEPEGDAPTMELKDSPVYHPFLTHAREAQEELEEEDDLKMPEPYLGGRE